jgi:hypothetical protein
MHADDLGGPSGALKMQDKTKLLVVLVLLFALAVAVLVLRRIATRCLDMSRSLYPILRRLESCCNL